MPKLLIENLVPVFELDYRNLIVIIDCALEAHSLKKNNNHSEFSKLLSNKNELNEKELKDILNGLTNAYKKGIFNQMATEANPNMEEMIERLCPELGFSDPAFINRMVSSVATMKDYEKALIDKPQAYTELLGYKRDLSPVNEALNKATQELLPLFESLFSTKSKAANWFNLNLDKNRIEVNGITQFMPNQALVANHATDLAKLYLKIMLKMVALKEHCRCGIAEEDIHFFCTHLTALLDSYAVQNESVTIIRIIENLLQRLHAELARGNLKKSVAEMLSKFIMDHKALRAWQTPTELLSEKKPIHRVILFGPEDIADDEILCCFEMMIKKHPKENIVVTCFEADVKKIDKLNSPFILQVIGHGTIQEPQHINANLGPYRGQAQDTSKQVATLVNDCLNINYVRLSNCFSGVVVENADLTSLVEKEQSIIEGMKTLTLTTDSALEANQPFLANSAVLNCWNNIKKDNREMSLTVSPGIIEPDLQLGAMTWRKSTVAPRVDDNVKEIRITTPNGPKALKAH